MKRSLAYLLSSLLLGSAASVRAASTPAPEPARPLPPEGLAPELRFTDMFRPFATDRAALSPDGRYLAYTVRAGETVSVAVVEIDHPETLKCKVQVATDDASTPMMEVTRKEKTPARVRWLGWVTPTRVVVETNQNFARDTAIASASKATTGSELARLGDGRGSGWQNAQGAIYAFDADGANGKLLVTPSDVADHLTNSDPDFTSARADWGRRHDSVFRADRPNMGVETWRGEDAPVQNLTVANNSAATATTTSDDPAATADLLGSAALRGVSVFDYCPDDPQAVLLRATGGDSFGIYKLDAVTGKLEHRSEEAGDPRYAPLLDRQGHPRAGVANSTLTDFPHSYVVEIMTGFDRWKKLDRIVGLAPDRPGFSVSPENYFGERAVPVGFDENPQTLYFASNIGRDRYGIFSLDLKTGKPGDLALIQPDYDLFVPNDVGFAQSDTLVFDRYYRRLVGIRFEGKNRTARWLRPEWQVVQDELEQVTRGRSVEILEWDQAGNRFLLLSRSPTDAGSFSVYDRTTHKLSEFVQRAPWLRPDTVPARVGFAFTKPAGEKVSGVLTAPRNQRTKLIPMVVHCPSVPWERLHSDYQSEINALADMGFAVVQLNPRGAWGFGVKYREAIKAGYEEAQVADIAFVVDELAKQFKVNGQRVALLGDGYGGFVAFRALQLQPDRFRCAVAINAVVDPGEWLANTRWTTGDPTPLLIRSYFGDEARLKAAPLVHEPRAVKKPICLLSYGGLPGEAREPLYLQARQFARAVSRPDVPTEVVDLEPDYMAGLPKARSVAFRKIEEFLNAHVYDYEVQTGTPKKLDD